MSGFFSAMIANKEEKGKNMMSVCFRSDRLGVHKLLYLLDYTHTSNARFASILYCISLIKATFFLLVEVLDEKQSYVV